jgi:CDP-paratose 2-epimerase
MPAVVVTGSCGLIGSEVSLFFARQGFQVSGIDDNHRAVFFGPEGDTSWVLEHLRQEIPGYRHAALDIRDRDGVLAFIEELRPDLIIHTAAQPSHDRAAAIPFLDFEVNALGTLHMLEAARRSCPESPFIHMSTNKVYGDRPNAIALHETATRFDYADPAFEHGIPEDLSIDQSTHSLFGASKVASDIMVQEYGRYYNLHSQDVARFMFEFWKAPRVAEVYNLGGGKSNACSILEAFQMAERITGRPMTYRYVEENRGGDHICYYSDLRKMRAHYPAWDVSKNLDHIFEEIAAGWMLRLGAPADMTKLAAQAHE